MKEECLICKAPLEYLEKDILMECEICHKKENSKTRCINGHYVCNDCHTQGLDTIIGLCLKETSKNPIAIVEKMILDSLTEMMNRGKSVPGGACGFWGACGAGISTGMFISIISKSTPLTNEPFALSHKMTAQSLGQIGEIGGPRCCKRDSFLSILAAVDFVKEHFGIEMEKPEIVCNFSSQNNQCIGKRCPFSKTNH